MERDVLEADLLKMDATRIGKWNRDLAKSIIQACLTTGIDHFFVAPGSRCTPLTLAIADCDNTKTVQHFDERGLTFCCLGYGRSSHKPGVFVCTSGTAVANALPGVIEAFQENVPMLLLTADRPPELHGIGANQTMNQQNIFGHFVRQFRNVDCPEVETIDPAWEDSIKSLIADSSNGPVHLNCMFREPFGTTDEPSEMRPMGENSSAQKSSTVQYGSPFPYSDIPIDSAIVILGDCRPEEARAVRTFAKQINVPLFSDVTSGLRTCAYDLALLRNDLPTVKNVIHFGGRFVSKRLVQFLERSKLQEYWQVWPHPQNLDPARKVTARFPFDLAMLKAVDVAPTNGNSVSVQHWEKICQQSLHKAQQLIDEEARITEPFVAEYVARNIPANTGLFLGNSMPVRDMDMFGFWTNEQNVRVGANRGTSGIDGLLASAVGFADGGQMLSTLILGDVSLLHDLNSLSLLKNSSSPVIVIVINNDGGGIFHFLPIANQTRHFEQYFGTPHGMQFEKAASQFQIPYHFCQTKGDFESAYSIALQRQNSVLIEVQTDRKHNLDFHRRIHSEIQSMKI